MALAGLSYGSINASSFSRAQNKVIKMGYPNDTNTFVMISGTRIGFSDYLLVMGVRAKLYKFKRILIILGMWLSGFSLGNFIGPTIAGILVEAKDFRFTSLVFFTLYLMLLVIDVFEFMKMEIIERRQAQLK